MSSIAAAGLAKTLIVVTISLHPATGWQVQPLADGDHVRVSHLVAVGPPHCGPVGRGAVGVGGDR